MAKTANLYCRIDPEIKEQAENILATLGIPASSAINIFYKQIILQNGLPFELKIPPHKFVDASQISAEELDSELEKGMHDIETGNTIPVDNVFAAIKKDYGL